MKVLEEDFSLGELGLLVLLEELFLIQSKARLALLVFDYHFFRVVGLWNDYHLL